MIKKVPAKKQTKIVTAKKPVAAKVKAAKNVRSKKVAPVITKPAAKKRGFELVARTASKRAKRAEATQVRRARRVVAPSSVAPAQVVDLVTARDNLIAAWQGPRGCSKVPVEFCRKNHDLVATFYRHDREGYAVVGSGRRVCGTSEFVADQLFNLLDGEEQENRANRTRRNRRGESEPEGFGIARVGGKKSARRQLSEHDARLNDRARARALKEQDRAVLLGGGAIAPKKPVFTGKSGFRPKNDLGAEKTAAFRPEPRISLAPPVLVIAAPVPVAPKPIIASPAAKPETPRVELKKYEHPATHCACCGNMLSEKESGPSDFYFKMYTHAVHPVLPAFINDGDGAEIVNGDRRTARRLCRECGVMINRAGEHAEIDQLRMLVAMVSMRGSSYAKAQLIAIAERYREEFALAYAKAKTIAAA